MSGQLAMQACVAEVLSPKAGNVHPQADFGDVTWLQFVTSAIVTAPILDCAGELGVGQTVLQCVSETRDAVGTNTNLGIVLLLAPLCAAEHPQRVGEVLSALTIDDTRCVYEAIRMAQPGGMGKVNEADVDDPSPRAPLVEVMRLAADRDAIARQYVNAFADVFDHIVPELTGYDGGLDDAIVAAHLKQMAREPDSLIRRKCGGDIALESQRRARAVLEAREAFDTLDDWLRADGHRRNPGTSADLVTAGVYTALALGRVSFPTAWSAQLP